MTATPELPRAGNPSHDARVARFGTFELDLRRAELRRSGVKVRIQEQPFRLLALLLQRAGEIVTREEIRERLWPTEFVDFDHSLNTAVRKLRGALDDSADNPRFVETLARRGYRFLAPVSWDAPVEASRPAETPARAPARPLVWALLALAVVAVAVVISRPSLDPAAPAPPQRVTRIVPLTVLGTVIASAISPDGKYLAYVTSEGGQYALWLKQVAGGGTLQLRPPDAVGYWGHTFHPDSNAIYYSLRTMTDTTAAVYRIDTIGGQPQKILERVESAVTFSPDGARMAFYRLGPKGGQSSLYETTVEGGGERLIRTWEDPEYVAPVFFGSPAWSPDGQTIACAVNDRRGGAWLALIDAADGRERMKTPRRFAYASQAAWLSKTELAFVGTSVDRERVPGVLASQIWRISLPSLAIESITNDILEYRNPTATADGSVLVAVVNTPFAGLWRSSLDGSSAPRKLSFGARDGLLGMAQAPDGKIVFTSPEGPIPRLWIAGDDGAGRQPLIPRSESGFAPSITPDGRTVVYETVTGGKAKLRRIGIDGGAAADICELPALVRSSISADGRWVYFSAAREAQQIVYRAPIEGGPPEQIATLNVTPFDNPRILSNVMVSPAGDRVAMFSSDSTSPGIRVISLRDGRSQIFPATIPGSTGMLNWMPDGSGILFSGTSQDRTNVWLQRFDRSPAKPVTAFEELTVFRFYCCRGNDMLVVRGNLNRDALMLRLR